MKVPFDPGVSLNHVHKRMITEIMKMDADLEEYLIPSEERTKRIHNSMENNIGWRLDEQREISEDRILDSIDMSTQTELPWSTNTIRNMRRRLIENSEHDDFRHSTEPKMAPNGREFTPCPHENIRNELANLMEWMETSSMDPISTAVLMVHEFESIRPFENGNSITATFLFHLYLKACGINNSMLCDIGSIICKDMTTYNILAMHAEKTGSYTPLVRFSIEGIHQAYAIAIDRMESLDLLKNMDENTRILSAKAKEKGRFTLTEATSWIDLGEQSVRMKLDSLVAAGILKKEGKTRGMRYVYNESGDNARFEEPNR
ncbi:MAG: Fic family protein [Candidatus Methanomethylophilaceae archaeon]